MLVWKGAKEMAEYLYVDNSNVFIEAQHLSAVSKGLAKSLTDAHTNNICDQTYRLDFGKLYNFVLGSNTTVPSRAVLYGSKPPQNDSVWYMAEKAGFEVVTKERNVANKEKMIDTGIVTEMLFDVMSRVDKKNDVISLIAGDADYVPPVERLTAEGYTVNVVFWSHAARQLKLACTHFINLNSHLKKLSL